jgi:hypothetical protein
MARADFGQAPAELEAVNCLLYCKVPADTYSPYQ